MMKLMRVQVKEDLHQKVLARSHQGLAIPFLDVFLLRDKVRFEVG